FYEPASRSSRFSFAPLIKVDEVHSCKYQKRKSEKDGRINTGRAIVHSLNLIVDGNGYDSRFAGNISTNHQYNAKLTDSVSKGQDTASDHCHAYVGQQYAQQRSHFPLAQCISSLHQ